jgi:hypothetical protein
MNKVERIYAQMLEEAHGEDRKNLERGMKLLGIDNPLDKEALRKSIRRLRPDFTDEQVELFVQGKAETKRDWV